MPASLPRSPQDREVGGKKVPVTYRDGTKGAVLRLGFSGTRWHFACKLARDERIYRLKGAA